jgi:hypothetical protein
MKTPTHYELYDPLSGRTIVTEKFRPPATSWKNAVTRIGKINLQLTKHQALNRARLPLTDKQKEALLRSWDSARLEAIRDQINVLTKEYLQLVAPTPEELAEAREQISEDGSGCAEVLSDLDDCLGQYMIADEILAMRSDRQDKPLDTKISDN